MDNKTNVIKQIYEEIFSVGKLRNDLLEHLEENLNGLYEKQGNFFSVDIYNKTTHESETRILEPQNDSLSVIYYISSYEFKTDFYYDIVVGIGEFTDEGNGFYTIGECFAKMKYNYDASLYDIDFYIDEMNKVK